MTQPRTDLLPQPIQDIVGLFTAAGYVVAQCFEDNGHRVLGDTTPQNRTERGLAELCHEQGVLDRVRILLRVPRTFETASIEYDERDLDAIASKAPANSANLPGHMPAVSRRVAERLLANGFRASGHLQFNKGGDSPHSGLQVTLSWC